MVTPITRADIEKIVDAHMDDIIQEIQKKMNIPSGDVAGMFFDGSSRIRERREFLQLKLVALHYEYATFEENERVAE